MKILKMKGNILLIILHLIESGRHANNIFELEVYILNIYTFQTCAFNSKEKFEYRNIYYTLESKCILLKL